MLAVEFSVLAYAVGVLCLSSAVLASPVARDDGNGLAGVEPPPPPCSNIRCAWGAPFYDAGPKKCMCPPFSCLERKPCGRGREAFYDWQTRSCACRLNGTVKPGDEDPEPEPETPWETGPETETETEAEVPET